MKLRTFIFVPNLIYIVSEPISITAISSISPLGTSLEEAWHSYKSTNHHFVKKDFNRNQEWIASLSEKSKQEIMDLRQSEARYKMLDDSVLFAIYASRNAINNANWKSTDNFGINIGSSRGATTLFEKYHEDFLQNDTTSTLASPTTTLGNISSWVAHDLQTKGPEISHSITCSTALHAMLNGIAWLQSGMADKFLVGGSEAPLTPFTIAQMRALKIYGKLDDTLDEVERSYPCRSLDFEKTENSMILGEGASMVCLDKGDVPNSLAKIIGAGYATEPLRHNVSISTDAQCFQKSMRMALDDSNYDEVDIIVMHAPGTLKGDLSEYKAIQNVFGDKLPALTTNKWKVGHTFGASGMLSVEMAILMLQHQKFIGVPFIEHSFKSKRIQKVMVNAVGFGGNAVSVLFSLP